MAELTGAMTALVTPLRDGAVDGDALRALVDAQIEAGIDGLVPCGTTGESTNLTSAEYSQVVKTVVDQARGRVPVVAGAGTNSTRHTLELCAAARGVGADAVLIVVPYYNRPTQEGLYQHFKTVAEAASLPVLLYNIPARTGVDLSIDTLERLAAIDAIVGIKEATGNALRSAEIAARFGDRFTILCGDDQLTIAVMAVGGHGVVSVASNVAPREVSAMVKLFREGDLPAARAVSQRLAPLFEAMFIEANPGPAKAALAMIGTMSSEIRLPLVSPSQDSLARIRQALEDLELL